MSDYTHIQSVYTVGTSELLHREKCLASAAAQLLARGVMVAVALATHRLTNTVARVVIDRKFRELASGFSCVLSAYVHHCQICRVAPNMPIVFFSWHCKDKILACGNCSCAS